MTARWGWRWRGPRRSGRQSKASPSTPGTGSAVERVALGRARSPTSPPSTSSRSREIAAGGEAEVDAAVAGRPARLPGLGRHCRGPSAPTLLRTVADGIDARAEDLARVETRDNGSLLRSHRRGVMPRVGMNFRFFADYLERLDHPDGEIRGHRERVTYDPAGVVADHHAVERPADARHLADRPGAGRRQHRGGQAAGVGAADRLAAGRHHPRGRPAGRRVQRGPGHRRAGRRPADRATRASAGCRSPARCRPPA